MEICKINENMKSCAFLLHFAYIYFSIWTGLRAGDIHVEARDRSAAEGHKVNSHINRTTFNFDLQNHNYI